MKNKRSSTFFIAVIAIAMSVAFSGFMRFDDDPVMAKIVAQLNSWMSNHPVEKIYLQLDKPYYTVGDDIWFKAYITQGVEHKLSTLSGSVNVELLDDRDSVRQWIKLPVNNGATWGDFALSDTLSEGTYRIRAYTNLMRNAGPDYYFDKAITIGNSVTNTVFTKVSYVYTTVGDRQKVTATINYSNITGAPYAGKQVNYKVQIGDRAAGRGKGITNDKGDVMVDYINPAQADKGHIITDIKIDDKSTITKSLRLNATSGKVDVQFFPESGNLVNGIRSKVAFKVVGQNGLGVNAKGVITDNQNNKITQFSTSHLGMGVFSLMPESGKTYKATITYIDGFESSANLPAALSSGYVLNITNTDVANINLRVLASKDLINAGQIYLLAQSGGEICYLAKSTIVGNFFNTTVPKNKFRTGIVQFTVFSAAGQPLNERIAFIQHDDNLLNLNVKSSKATSAPREKVKIDLQAQTKDGKPIIGSFSAAVIDDSNVKSDESSETSILSHILLTSDLKGYIEQPNYYFENSDETTRANLDVLMLTQGYRRFEWKSLLEGTNPPQVYQPEKFITIAGNVTTTGGKPIANAKVMIFTTAVNNTLLLETVTDKLGYFAFKDLSLKDSLHFVIQARTAGNNKNVLIKINNNSSKDLVVNNHYLSAINLTDPVYANYLKVNKNLYDEERKLGLGNHNILLKEVTIKEKSKPLVEYSDNLNGPGHADQIVTAADLNKVGCSTTAECLQMFLPNIRFIDDIPYYSIRNLSRKPIPMRIYLDGTRIFNFNLVLAHDIASVEVLTSSGYTGMYGLDATGGVMIITTKRGTGKIDYAQVYTPGLITYATKGYYAVREFYSPQYDDPKVNKTLADLRTTIFWKPDLITDQTGHASFEYYNAGSPGTYRVVIEGIDSDGNLGRKVYRYKVE